MQGFNTEAFLDFTWNPQNSENVMALQGSLLTAPNREELVGPLMKQAMQSPEFLQLFETKTQIQLPTNEELSKYEVGTLGHAVFNHLEPNGLNLEFQDLDVSVFKQQIATPPGYLAYRATCHHDVYHTVIGADISPMGEYALVSFQLGQFYSPLSMIFLASSILNRTFTEPSEIPKVLDQFVKFYEAGKRAKFFPGYAFEDNWAKPLDEVRADLNVTGIF